MYGRINIPWGFDGSWNDTEQGWALNAISPETSAPDDPYAFNITKNGELYAGDDIDNMQAGLVVPLNYLGSQSPIPTLFDGSPLVFSKS